MATAANLITVLRLEDDQFTASLRRAGQQTRDFRSTQERELRAAAAANEGFSRSLRGSLGNVAQQVQDVAVQFQSGTSAAIIFAQQGPQILGAFGPVGAMIGALAGVTAVAASAMFGFSRDADTAKASADAMEVAARGLDGTIAASADSVADLARKYRVLSDEMRTIERLSLDKKIRDSQEALSAIRDQIAVSVQAAKDSGQLALLQQSEALARLDPGATRDAGVAQLQRFLEGLDGALERSARGGLTKFADEVDRLATSLPEAGGDARKLADSFIAPADSAIKLATTIRQAKKALDGLAGKNEGGEDPFLDRAKAAEQAEKATERVAKAAEKAAAQSDRRQEALAREIAQNERLIAAGKQSADAYEQMRRVIEAENKAIAAGLDPKGREARILAEQTAELNAQSEARKRNTRAVEGQAKAHEKFYADVGKRIDGMFGGVAANENREVENLQRNLQSNVASAIERGFEDGFGSIGDLVDQFGSLLKGTVATALADQLISKGFAESISGALSKQLGQIFPSLGSTAAGQTTVGGAAAGGLGAAFGGYAIGQQFAGNRPLGTLAGAASGAGIGFVVGGLPGAAIGAGIGGIAGFFGSNSTGGTRNNNFQMGFDPLTGLPIEFQNTKPDPQNQGIVGGVLTELAALRDGLRAMGLGIGGGEFTVQAGNKSGLTLNGQSFGSASALTEAALRQLLTGATGLSAGQQTVLANSKARDAAGLLGDLAIPEQIQNLLNPLSNFSTALKEQTRIYAEANDNAQRLGLSTKGLAQAQERDRQKLVDAYKVELGIISPLEAQIRSIVDTFDQAIRSAKELGVSEAFLTRQRDKQLSAIRDQLLAQREQLSSGFIGNVGSAFGYLDQQRQFRDSLAVSNQNGTAQTRLAEARRQFEMVRRGALGGDIDALNQLTQAGQTYLTAARDYGGSGSVFQDAFKAVNDLLARTISQGETLEQRLLEGIEGQTKTIRDFYRELMNDRREMLEAIRTLERELEMLRKRAA